MMLSRPLKLLIMLATSVFLLACSLFIPDRQAAPQVQMTPTPLAIDPSPKSRLIAFESNREGNQDVFIVQSGSKELTNLTHHSADDRAPAWSPDGRQIAFISNRSGSDQVYVMDADGSNLRALTKAESSLFQPPLEWSPDGNWIALCRTRYPVNPGARTYLYLISLENPTQTGDIDSIPPTSDANGRPYLADSAPHWSPDGRLLGYLQGFSGVDRLHVIDPLTPVENTHISTEPPPSHGLAYWWDAAFSWSPKGEIGKVIMGANDQDGSVHAQLQRGTLKAGETTLDAADLMFELPLNSPPSFNNLGWSPDGQHLILTFIDDTKKPQLYLIDAQSNKMSALTTNPGAAYHARWAPDQNWIVYSYWNQKGFQLYANYLDGKEPIKLTDGRFEDILPRWQPRGN